MGTELQAHRSATRPQPVRRMTLVERAVNADIGLEVARHFAPLTVMTSRARVGLSGTDSYLSVRIKPRVFVLLNILRRRLPRGS